jgi:hypothetical protein
VTASFSFIWPITGVNETITGAVLGLIGIDARTALGAVTVDTSKEQGNKSMLVEGGVEALTLAEQFYALFYALSAYLQIDIPHNTLAEHLELFQPSSRLA